MLNKVARFIDLIFKNVGDVPLLRNPGHLQDRAILECPSMRTSAHQSPAISCSPRVQCRSSAAPECNAPARARGRGSPGAVANMCSGVSTQTEARGGSEMLLPTSDTACSFSTQSRSDANCFKVTAPHSKARQGKKYILCSECLGNVWLVVTCSLF